MHNAIKGFPTTLINGISQLMAILTYSGDFSGFCVIRENFLYSYDYVRHRKFINSAPFLRI